MSWVKKAKDYLFERHRAYNVAFAGVSGQIVLQDLARFCRANESCFHQDPRLHAELEGRREVWLRIQHHLKMTPDQMVSMHIPTNQKENDD